MWKLNHVLMNAEAGPEAEGAGAAGLGETRGNEITPSEPTSLLTTGSAKTDDSWLPEKYRVTDENGQVNLESSARKLADAYSHLEKRMGSGDAPPKTPHDYAPEIEAEGFSWEEFKSDPQMQAFLIAAHEKGLTNEQMSFVMNEYLQRAPDLVKGSAALDADTARNELRETWKTDAEFDKNLGLAYRAFHSLADDADKARIDDIGNNPMIIRMLAKVGAEMQEDTPRGLDVDPGEQQTIRDLMKSEAYSSPRHPDHERVTRLVRDFYVKTYGNAPVN